MAEIKVPKLGDNIEAADVVSVLVAVGDQIEVNQALIEVESDKAAVEIPSDAAGVVKEVKVAEGESIHVGQVIIVLEESAAAESPPAAAPSTKESPAETTNKAETHIEAASSASTASGPVEVRVPKLGDNIEAADIVSVLVAVGDQIEVNQALIEVESDKAAVEIPSDAAGVVKEVKVAAGESINVGQVIIVLEGTSAAPAARPEPVAPAKAAPQKAPAAKAQPQTVNESKAATPAPVADSKQPLAPAAPSVRRFARELGVDIHAVSGTGPRGRISRDDVKAHVKARLQTPAVASSPTASIAVPDMPDFSQYGPIQLEKMGNVRKATARQMNLSWTQIPHVTQFDQADITDAETFRKKFGKMAEKAGGKLTVTAILMKLCAIALKRFPQFNASIDLKNEQIIYKQHYHLGVAVDTPRGLLVPVLRDVDQKGLIDIAVEIGEVALKARDRKLGPDALSGGTFTISNLGGLGTTYFTPIVNWPQVAILGVGRASQQPVWQEDHFVPRQIMPLSLSYDHRLIDGADAARFLRWIAVALENPLTLLLEGDL